MVGTQPCEDPSSDTGVNGSRQGQNGSGDLAGTARFRWPGNGSAPRLGEARLHGGRGGFRKTSQRKEGSLLLGHRPENAGLRG